MLSITNFQEYYRQEKVFMTSHAVKQSQKRAISQGDIENCVCNGEIIEYYPDDYPFPSCLIYGNGEDEKIIHVVICDTGEFAKIITAYIPNTDTFEGDLKTRKEKEP